LMPSHLIVLSRATPSQRARGVEALLDTPCSVRELKRLLRKYRSGMVSESATAPPAEPGRHAG
jgi:hypothetical protein